MVVIGGFLLLAAVLIAPSVLTAWRQWRAVTVEPAATARPGDAVVASGRVVAPSRGLVTAPLSGQPCAWYQEETRRHLQRPARSGPERDVRVDSVNTSDRAFGVADTHGRVVAVDPDGLRQAGLLWSHREERSAQPHERMVQGEGPGRSFGRRMIAYEVTGYELLEWILTPDQEVVIAGRLAADGQVVAGRGPYEVRGATVGEVRRHRMRTLIMAVAGTVITAVAGLILTIAGT